MAYDLRLFRLSIGLIIWIALVLTFLLAGAAAAIALLTSGKFTTSSSGGHSPASTGSPTTGAHSTHSAGPAAGADRSGAPASVPGLASFTFPAGVTVKFQTGLPSDGPRQSAVIGYENYARSMWYAVATRGSGSAHQQYAFGNARTFTQSLVSEFNTDGWKLRGTIVYYDVSVPGSYSSASAVVTACVNASGLYRVSQQTGDVVGTVFGTTYDHYLEQASVGEEAGGSAGPSGSWVVTQTGTTPASSGGAAGACG